MEVESGDRGHGLESEEENQKSAMGPVEAAVEKEMPAYFHLKPGQKGTKRLMAKYGDALFCIRFRYDEETCKRIKTVELIEEESDWMPPPQRFASDALVPLRIAASNMTLRAKVKSAGGKWMPEEQQVKSLCGGSASLRTA